ncbi:MAG TPA: hypothetical protein VGL89_05890 [Candidatus Koribacter sp.]|jgi:hypothetical protein
MSASTENRRLLELLWMRARRASRMRNSENLREVWRAYQDLKTLDIHIAIEERVGAE